MFHVCDMRNICFYRKHLYVSLIIQYLFSIYSYSIADIKLFLIN